MNHKARLSVLGVAVLALGLFGASTSYAQSASSNVGISASVAANCEIQTTTAVAFGAYDPLGTSDLTANGEIEVRCTKGTAALITLDEGVNPALGSTCAAPDRQMAAGAERLAYDLYQDAGLTTVWGCDAANDKPYAAANRAWAAQTIYGNLPQGQDVGVGNYSDTVQATISF